MSKKKYYYQNINSDKGENMKFCTNCGKEIEDDSMFCNKCGAPQEVVKPELQPVEQVLNQSIETPSAPIQQTVPTQQIPVVQAEQEQQIPVDNVKKKKKWRMPVIIVSACLIVLGIAFFLINSYVGGCFTKEGAAKEYLEARYNKDAEDYFDVTLSLKAIEYLEEEYGVSKEDIINNLSKNLRDGVRYEIRNVEVRESREVTGENGFKLVDGFGAPETWMIEVSYEISYNGGEWIKIDDGDVLVYYSNCKWYGYGGIRDYIE